MKKFTIEIELDVPNVLRKRSRELLGSVKHGRPIKSKKNRAKEKHPKKMNELISEDNV